MKQVILFILFITFTMHTTLSAQWLSERQKQLATVACLEAQGDMDRLEAAIGTALDRGITVNELKEAFSQLYAYTGFPRSLNALNKLKAVLDDRQAKGLVSEEGKPWTRPALWDDAAAALQRGTEVQTKLLGGKPYNYDFCPQDDHYLKAHLFGDIFAGDQLSEADREIVTVAALSGLKGVESQLASHKLGAVQMGNSPELVEELCRYLSEQGLSQTDHAADASAGDWPKGNPNDAYAQYFSGNSYLATLQPKNLSEGEQTAQRFFNVTFEPGCRNNWHIHHAQSGGGQILICVAGRGFYQEAGKPAQALHPGDVVNIPVGVKHWHGAAPDSWFSHLAVEVPGTETANEWLEAVNGAEYAKATTEEV